VHLQMLEEINILARGERYEHAHGSRECGVDDEFRAARNEGGLMETVDGLSHVVATEKVSLGDRNGGGREKIYAGKILITP
jgi:hypothetical protein